MVHTTRSNNSRLVVAALRILLGFTVVSIFLYLTVDKSLSYRNDNELLNTQDVSRSIVDFIIAVGAERGKSMEYLTNVSLSPGSLTPLRDSTNFKMDVMVRAFSAHTLDLSLAVKTAVAQLDSVRSKVTNRTVLIGDVLEFYTNITTLSVNIVDFVSVTNNNLLSVKLLALASLVHMMDWSGVRRGVVNSYLVNTSQTDLFKYMAEANSKYLLYKEKFLLYATPEEITIYYSQFQGNATVVSSQKFVESVINDVLGFSQITENVSNGDWWSNNTFLISAVQQIFLAVLAETENYKNSTVKPQSETKLIVFVIGFILELIASIQLCWMAAPIFSFWFKTSISSLSGEKTSTKLSKSKESKESKESNAV